MNSYQQTNKVTKMILFIDAFQKNFLLDKGGFKVFSTG